MCSIALFGVTEYTSLPLTTVLNFNSTRLHYIIHSIEFGNNNMPSFDVRLPFFSHGAGG